MSDFAAAIAAAAAAAPMGSASVPVARRILLVDGDGLAYYCAGNDDTSPGEARANLISKVKAAQRVCGAEDVRILLTASGSHKGHRYAIARVKPYQGQRANSRRPANWRHLRDSMSAGTFPFDIQETVVAEADDLFGWWAYNYPDDAVIYTQDKDMRMLPGMHLDWVSHRIHKVEYTLPSVRHEHRMYNVQPQDSVFNDKQYGHKWFWLQMLHGDTADHIPGLPKYSPNWDAKFKLVGEVTAGKLLDESVYSAELPSAAACVAYWYQSYYGKRWLVEMMEQACLLWMRRDPTKWDDCMEFGGPLYQFNDAGAEFSEAYAEIEKRVLDADNINATATEAS